MRTIKNKLHLYYLTAIFSFLFALVGFSYNAWRMEASEFNNNVRTASFEVLENLAELEQNVYAAHYDNDEVMGSARIGWVKIGLINDLSTLISSDVAGNAMKLKLNWSEHWTLIPDDIAALEQLVSDIDKVREAIKYELEHLQ
ncbi:hypothetical protein [Thalassotalea atypica]|uniref:hypothetical protein n=1 Tax=Thalassotalea atypica TaxID=2054316 RepID=UPI0025732808|nr:hypothetical protein [Thalassotalea atypica]